jgi:hypothetical protein
MPKRLTRREMYDLAWSEPMRTLAKTFGISDVGLAKYFHQMHVPIPLRGYWARKTAGKPTARIPRTPRPVGLDDHVWIGGSKHDRYYRSLSDQEILGPLPPEPTFDEPLDAVRAKLETIIGKVTVPKSLDDPNPTVATLLRADDDKRERQKARSYYSTYDAPLYETQPQRRRLRLLSAIFNAAASHGARTDTWGIRSSAELLPTTFPLCCDCRVPPKPPSRESWELAEQPSIDTCNSPGTALGPVDDWKNVPGAMLGSDKLRRAPQSRHTDCRLPECNVCRKVIPTGHWSPS